MKKLTALFLSAAIILGVTISPLGVQAKEKVQLAFTPCEAPITYRIDKVDPQFNLTREEFIEKVGLAANVWNNSYDKTLFSYDPNGKISINLTYDGRQGINDEINSLEGNISNEKGTLNEQKALYEERGNNFEIRVQKLNQDIAYWNEQGGAPEEEYKKLQDEQSALRNEAAILNETAANLNQSTSTYNSSVKDLNQSINTFNNVLKEKPEEGVYSEGDLRIDIYFNNDINTLTRTVAHELGHSRGLDHVQNESAVMYEKTFPEYSLTTEDLKELERACRKRTVKEAITESIRNTVLELKRKSLTPTD